MLRPREEQKQKVEASGTEVKTVEGLPKENSGVKIRGPSSNTSPIQPSKSRTVLLLLFQMQIDGAAKITDHGFA